jgi:ribonucleoside-diphosphate reductase alpha chain
VAKAIGKNTKQEKAFFEAIRDRKFIPGGRYLYSAGREIQQVTNCFLYKAEDSREGWANLIHNHMMVLSTGGGAGTYYGDIREKGAPIKRFGGVASGPISLMKAVNEVARQVMAGGKRRSALWSGLPWWHPDIEDFIKVKDWSTAVRAMKESDFNFPADLDMMNISVCLDDGFFNQIKKKPEVWDLYYRICKKMLKTGEPGFSIDVGTNSKDKLRNPCTEIVSSEDSDSCNLGSINLSRIPDVDELEKITRLATQFLYNGTFVSWVPHPEIGEVRAKNRRIGLGLMGLHEWCIKNGQTYGPSDKLGSLLSVWKEASIDEASQYSVSQKGVEPIALRAIAPTGTIGIIGETTTGVEPIFCVAYKRRFLDKDGKWKFSYVIDPTAERLIQEGAKPEDIEDSQTLALDVEKRIKMQAFVQQYVDQAISSTINLPEWGEPGNNNAKKFAETLLQYLPKLRGITVYPEGARPGAPLVPIAYETAKKHKDVVFEENNDLCKGGVCGA